MNFNQQPTIDDLSTLFASRKDKHSSHILWLCSTGEVRLDPIAPEMNEEDFMQRKPSMRARFRTYRQGKGYVGRKAAADRQYMESLYQRLQHEWRNREQQGSSEINLIDSYC